MLFVASYNAHSARNLYYLTLQAATKCLLLLANLDSSVDFCTAESPCNGGRIWWNGGGGGGGVCVYVLHLLVLMPEQYKCCSIG